MPGSRPAGPTGLSAGTATIDEGTLARARAPEPGTIGSQATVANAESGATPASAAATPAAETDPAIEALDLRGAARTGAYALKKAHPSVRFTSGRRDKADQARAMASNVVLNRKWIEETYATSPVSKLAQKWVDDNPDKKSQDDIAAGLLSVFEAASDADLARLSKHLSGDAFDVQPVETDADAIKKTIRGLTGLDKFLEKEGGLVRWHAQF
jgi:hypothetical protein